MSRDREVNFDQEIKEIRAIVDRLPRIAGGKRTGVTPELRARIVHLWQRSHLKGDAFAEAIGFSFSLIAKWQHALKQDKPLSKFKRVKVLRSQATPSCNSKSKSPSPEEVIAIEGPGGLKFSLSNSELVDLLRRLAC